MLQKFKFSNNDYKIIFKNFSYLTALKVINIGFKVALVAYLIRVLGDINYGLITWLDSLIQYLLMIINFGFNIYAAKYIVDFIKDKNKINEIVSSIYIIKTILFLLTIIVIIILSSLEGFIAYRKLMYAFILAGIGEILFPIWFFQGQENLKPATIIVFISRLTLVIGALIFVTSQDDIFTYIIIFVFSSIVMGVLGAGYIFKQNDIKLVRVSLSSLGFFLRESFPFFLGRFLSLVFNFGTIFLIGKYCELNQVAGFDLSLKIIMLGVIPFEMLQQAVFPSLARTRNKKMLKNMVIIALIVGLLVGLFTFILSSELLLLFGGESMLEYTSTLRFLTLLSPFVSLTFILGTCSLVAFGYYKQYNFSLIFTSLIYFAILLVLFFMDLITFWNLVYLRVFGDVLMCLIRGYYSIKKGVLVLNYKSNSI